MTYLRQLWQKWTAPQAIDPDVATREYITRVVATMMGLALIATTAIILVGWAAGVFDLETILRIVGVDMFVGLGLWLIRQGHWQVTSFLLPTILFLQALNGALWNGAETQLSFFALAILLTGTLYSIRVQWYAVGLCLLTYLLALWFHGDRAPDLLATGGTQAFIFFVGITLLQWLFVSQLKGALAKARRYATELTEHQDHLEELVATRYQELQAANRELEREIDQRRQAEAALQEAHARLEARVQERTADLEATNRLLIQENAERKRAEKALRESEARYRHLVDHAPTGIYEIDLTNFRFLSVNDVMVEYMGYTREEFLTLNPLAIMTEESQQRFLKRQARMAAGQPVPETAEYKIMSKSGREFWVVLNVRVTYQEGQPVKATVVVHDVTARRQAEEALRRSQALLESLVQSLPQNIYSKDLEGRFTFVNQQYSLTAGKPPQEIIGKTDFDIHPRELARKYREDDRRVIESGQPFEAEEKHEPLGQDSFYVQVIKSPIYDTQGEVTGTLGIFWDVTERRRAEQAIHRSVAELQNLQRITEALLSLESLPQVMNAVAQGIVTHLELDMALVSRYVEEEETFAGLALYPLPHQFDRFLQILGRQDLHDNPTAYRLPYRRGKNRFIDRALDGELVIGESLADFFAPWVPRPASAAVQKLAGVQCLADVPMQVKDKTVGTILVATRQPAISPEQRQALMRVASQAAVAVENSRLYDAERQRAAELSRSNAFLTALSQVAARIERTPSPNQILETLGRELGRLGITCFLALRKADTGELVGHYTSVESTILDRAQKLVGLTVRDFQIPSDSQPFVQVMELGEPLFITDLVAMTSDLLPQIPQRLVRQALTLAGVAPGTPAAYLPLKVEDKALGLMTVWGQDLQEEDVPAFSIFAYQVAVSLENARLVQDLEWSLRELQETQNQLVQAQKMEAVGRLAGGVAHDFNNLLTIVELSTRLIARQLHPRDPLWEHIRQIQEASERGTRLTQQLLRFSRREAIEPQVIDLSRLILEMDRMLQRIVGENIELVTDLARDLWPVRADLSQMEQVVVNLTVNARDAMPAGGKLSIRTANVTLTDAADVHHLDVEPGEYILLHIADNGQGMDPEVLEHIFEPFFTTKERDRGTGLGLPTVYGIVRQSQGYIEVESEPGQGTSFRIYLPRTSQVKSQSQVRRKTPPPARMVRGTETILVVEDEIAVRRLARQLLEEHGYRVLEAANGPEALDVSRQHDGPIDLLLTDVIMPGMNGRELAQQICSEREGLRVLYMSGYSDDVIAMQAPPPPGTAILSKPFSMEALSAQIRAVLDKPDEQVPEA